MLIFNTATRIFVALERVDMRQSVNGKRLNRKTFGWPKGEGSSRLVRAEELSLLVHGLEETRRRNWPRIYNFFTILVSFDCTPAKFSARLGLVAERLKLQGRMFAREDLEQIRGLIASNPGWISWSWARRICGGSVCAKRHSQASANEGLPPLSNYS
jgi:hypothetical protein